MCRYRSGWDFVTSGNRYADEMARQFALECCRYIDSDLCEIVNDVVPTMLVGTVQTVDSFDDLIALQKGVSERDKWVRDGCVKDNREI